jgi:SnoaL-like domain
VTGGWLSPVLADHRFRGDCHVIRCIVTRASLSPQEATDRLAIRELIDAYAHCVDRRDAKGQMALFTPDIRFLVYMGATDEAPTQRAVRAGSGWP